MFGKKRFLEPEIEEWQLECWAYLMRNLGGLATLRDTPLVLPTADFFGRPTGRPQADAEAVFMRVKALMGMNDWPCALVMRHDDNAELGDFVRLMPEKGIGGTFEAADGEVLITYAPSLLSRPMNLIATFAHELAHYMLHTIKEQPPGADVEPMMEELATDLAVAYFGFGVISANAAFEFEQYQDAGRHGWRSGASGYLTEDSWVFAIATFLALRASDDRAIANPHLKPHLAKRLSAALAYLDKNPALLAPLREIAEPVSADDGRD